MISSINIENFRCFHKLSINDFKRFNLIGGKNNSGKTVLLESIFLGTNPGLQTILNLKSYRQENLTYSKATPENAWNTLFYNQNKSKEIKLFIEKLNNQKQNITITSDNEIDEFINISDDEELKNSNGNTDRIEIKNLLLNKNLSKSTLHINIELENNQKYKSSIVAHTKGIMAKDLSITLNESQFIPAGLKKSNKILAEEYDKTVLNGTSDTVLEILKIIDPSIIDIKTFSIGEPNINLKRNNENYLPISLFGDSLNKIIDIILTLLNNKGSILLIDELENGLHYTCHKELLISLIKLAKLFDIQIFATTHSIELINAFKDVTLNNELQNECNYLEFIQHIKTGKIKVLQHDSETLEYELTQNKGIRGE